MPELPEVETVLRGLSRLALGRKIVGVEVSNPAVITGSAAEFKQGVVGRFITSLRRKGKALAAELRGSSGSAPAHIVIRLGMTGSVTIVEQSSPLQPHTHVRFRFEDCAEEMRFRDPRRFGSLRYCSDGELEAIFGRMGPDALEISREDFEEARRGRTGAVKGWLLNQAMLAGLGNIYADEALYQARIHPRAPAGRISTGKSRELFCAIQKVLDRAVKLQGTTFRDYIDIEGRPGNYGQRLRVYQRDGKPCRRCGTILRRIIVCGRSSHFCPECQPLPRRPAAPGRPRTARAKAGGPKRRPQNRDSRSRRGV
ncbi:MAG TPA: bifunctional DNA-formamidopyrimidine glycosylase/DNA-(apurinic or apyrimidinic site) lyase [Terriglobia bacterium]|nr:bifunctional DNA-formamidopyrimidine glycosylase/DNA-(apurinic or apyrimidinic site) lyase [Terriglobia bacterium]